jgi:hypothetical protein
VAIDRALAQQVEDAGLTAATTLAIDQKRRD